MLDSRLCSGSCARRYLAGGVLAVLVELSVMEQRYHAVMEVLVAPVPSRSTVYRVLVREHLVAGRRRRRPRSSFTAWERPAPMLLWQLDITGKVWLADGTELKLVTGIDDHSRFMVIAHVVRRAT